MDEQGQTEKLFTVKDLETILKVSDKTVYRLIKAGELKSFRLRGAAKGAAIRVRASELERYLNSLT